MAVVIGTNSGFVSTAPTSNPSGSNPGAFSDQARAIEDTSPATAERVTEIGFYAGQATAECNFEVGIYEDDGGNPGALLGVSRTNAKGTTEGWKKATVDITIIPNTLYHMAFQLDADGVRVDYGNDARGYTLKDGVTTLPDPYAGTPQANFIFAIYAVWDVAPTPDPVVIEGSLEKKDIRHSYELPVPVEKDEDLSVGAIMPRRAY